MSNIGDDLIVSARLFLAVGLETENEHSLITEETKMCDVLNKIFSSVYSIEKQEGLLMEVNNFFQKDISSALCRIEITEEIVEINLKILKLGKAPSIDGLVPKFIIEMADVICKPLALINQKSIDSSMVPKVWKKVIVMTILTREIRRQVPCKWKQICRNILIIICTLEN